MSRQNKKTLSVVFVLAIFVAGIYGIAATQESDKITLREYVDMRVGEIQRAVDKADQAMTERLKILNEFKDTYLTAQNKFATKEVVDKIDAAIQVLQEKFVRKETVDKVIVDVRELRTIADIAQGAATQGQFFIFMIGSIIGMVSGVVSLALNWKKFKK